MNILSRPVAPLLSVLTGLLLAGAILWRCEILRQRHAAENKHYEQECLSLVADLRLAQDAMNTGFLKNGMGLLDARKPVPYVAKNDSSPAAVSPTPVALAPVILQGISWGDNPVAMVDGKVYQTGDRINDCTLEEIRALNILLRGPDGTGIVIRLREKNP